MHDDAVRDSVERSLPDFLGSLHSLEEPRVIERERGHLRETFKQRLLFSCEMMLGAIANDERAQGFAPNVKRRDRYIEHTFGRVHGKIRCRKLGPRAYAFDNHQTLRARNALKKVSVQGHHYVALFRLARTKTTCGFPRHRLVCGREAGNARRVRAHNTPYGVCYGPQRHSAFGLSRVVSSHLQITLMSAHTFTESFSCRHHAPRERLPHNPGQGIIFTASGQSSEISDQKKRLTASFIKCRDFRKLF